MFFVISGYLITSIILRELQSDRFSFRQFYARRIRRLFPALIVVLLTTLVLGWLILLPDEFRRLGMDAAAGTLFSENLILWNDVTPYFFTWNRPLTHLWSLGVEEQFYLLWPVLLFLTWKVGKHWMTWIAASVIAASLLNSGTMVSFDPQASFYLPWNRLWELALGAILADREQLQLARSSGPLGLSGGALARFRPHLGNVYGLCGVALLAGSFICLNGTMEFPGYRALAPSVGTALLIAAGPKALFNRAVLSLRPVILIGLISYPLYLWHWSLLCFSHLAAPTAEATSFTIVMVLLAFVLAFVTFRFVELPLRHSPCRPPLVTTLCALLAFCGLFGYLTYLRYIPSREVSLQVARLMAPVGEDWLSERGTSWTVLPKQFVEIGAAPKKTLFVGDSFMEQYYPRIERVVRESGGRDNAAVFAVRGACSLPYEFSWAYGRAACKQHVERALEYAERNDVDTVVIASLWLGYFMNERRGELVLNPEARPALVRLRNTIAALRRMSKRVYIVLVGPIDPALDPRLRIQRTVLSPGFRVLEIASPSKADLQQRYLPIQSQLRQIAVETGAIIIDPMESLCNAVICPAQTHTGEAIYRDMRHLRPSYVRENARFMDETVLPLPVPSLLAR
jgi:peptidoglycan/LPS O-acetylase OafA/YrhL